MILSASELLWANHNKVHVRTRWLKRIDNELHSLSLADLIFSVERPVIEIEIDSDRNRNSDGKFIFPSAQKAFSWHLGYSSEVFGQSDSALTHVCTFQCSLVSVQPSSQILHSVKLLLLHALDNFPDYLCMHPPPNVLTCFLLLFHLFPIICQKWSARDSCVRTRHNNTV